MAKVDFLSLGIPLNDDLPAEVKANKRLINFLLFFYSSIGIGFLLVVSLILPAMAHYSAILLVLCGVIAIMNFLGYHRLGGFVLSIGASIDIALSVNAIQGQLPLLSTSLLGLLLAASITPWLSFQNLKSYFLWIANGVNLLLFVGVLFLPPLENIKLSLSETVELIFSIFTSINAFAGIGGGIYYLVSQKNEEKKVSEELIHSLEDYKLKGEQSKEELTKTVSELQTTQKEENIRNWIVKGLSDLNAFIRNEIQSEEFYPDLIALIVKYLKINQAGIFVISDDEKEKYLELKAAYAFERRKFIKKKIGVEDGGLLGQCFLEKEKIFLKAIPDNYLAITSGLGDAPPGNIVMFPLKYNDLVEGVLEVASFRILEEHEVEYLEKAGDIIGGVLRQIKINTHTKELFERTQEQAEQLKAQEEELRQNNEEILAQREDLERRVKKQISIISQLKSVHETETINLSGRQRMLSQKMGYLATLYYFGDNSVGAELLSASQLFNDSLAILRDGGNSSLGSKSLELKPTEGAALLLINELMVLWVAYKERLNQLINVNFSQNSEKTREDNAPIFEFIKNQSANLLSISNDVTLAIQKEIEFKKESIV